MDGFRKRISPRPKNDHEGKSADFSSVRCGFMVVKCGGGGGGGDAPPVSRKSASFLVVICTKGVPVHIVRVDGSLPTLPLKHRRTASSSMPEGEHRVAGRIILDRGHAAVCERLGASSDHTLFFLSDK